MTMNCYPDNKRVNNTTRVNSKIKYKEHGRDDYKTGKLGRQGSQSQDTSHGVKQHDKETGLSRGRDKIEVSGGIKSCLEILFDFRV